MSNERTTQHEVSFRPRARLVSILGEHLISDQAVGLIELVKEHSGHRGPPGPGDQLGDAARKRQPPGERLEQHDADGVPRFYRRTRIALEDGAAVETYLLPPEHVEGRPVIASGNWRSRRKETAA